MSTQVVQPPPHTSVSYNKTLVASVTSQPTPDKGQHNRTSEDFPIQNLPAGVNGLMWEIPDGAPGITFDVMINKSVADDPTVFTGLSNAQMSPPKRSRAFYIANPRNATAPFTINVYSLTPQSDGNGSGGS